MKTKIYHLLSLLLVSLLGCSPSSGIEEAIRVHLKDPSSAQFKNLVVNADKTRACVTWNARNSLGGYAEWTTSELRFKESNWVIKEMEQSPSLCSREYFDLLDEEKELAKKVLKMDGVPEELKVAIRRGQTLEHHSPKLVKDTVELLKLYINAAK